MGEFVIYGLDPQSFKNLALNFEQIKRYIEQQKEVIIYYEEAVKPKEEKSPCLCLSLVHLLQCSKYEQLFVQSKEES